eukprot:6227885-Amphidinium_carterae.1
MLPNHPRLEDSTDKWPVHDAADEIRIYKVPRWIKVRSRSDHVCDSRIQTHGECISLFEDPACSAVVAA